MNKLMYSIVASAILVLQGCAVYHAPWDEPSYKEAPVSKETKVYHTEPKVGNTFPTQNVEKIPTLNEKTNVNKSVKVNKSKATVKNAAFTEKKIHVSKPKVNATPKVSQVVKLNREEPLPTKESILVIPIE